MSSTPDTGGRRPPREQAAGTLRASADTPHRRRPILRPDTPSMLELRYEHGGEEHRVDVRDAEFLIGRAPGCTLVLPDDSVSRRHARIRRSGSGWTIEDLSSKNGLRINSVRAQQHALRDGDRLAPEVVLVAASGTAARKAVGAVRRQLLRRSPLRPRAGRPRARSRGRLRHRPGQPPGTGRGAS